jgi:ubiquitin-activating enzyme E1
MVQSGVHCGVTVHDIFQDDAEEFLSVFKEVNASSGAKCEELNENVLREFAYGARGDLCPLAAVIGGITAQEVMKVTYSLYPVLLLLFDRLLI